MKILHYTLGLPPYRTGGLTKYSIDLAKSEKEILKQDVAILFPGRYTFNKKTKIKKTNAFFNIPVYELFNPLPVPLLAGIKNPDKFKISFDTNIFLSFLNKFRPSIIHIHTLMGLPKEFLDATKKLKIKTIFTTHDYFGLCFKVNFVCNGELCDGIYDKSKCANCNKNGYSQNLIKIMQSKLYRNFKKNKCFELIKRIKKISLVTREKPIELLNDESNKFLYDEYDNLNAYYKSMFKLIDFFHFNSSVSKMEFEKKLGKLNGKILNITHSKIKDNRKIKKYNDKSKLKITYLGPFKKYKGIKLLLDVINELNCNNLELNLYGDINIEKSIDNRIIYNGKYNYNELEEIFSNTDVLLVPSIWKETYGFVGLEAFSNAVPVILTENVGFKDIIQNNITGLVVKADKESIKKELISILNNKNILKNINKNILETKFHLEMKKHVSEVLSIYRNILK